MLMVSSSLYLLNVCGRLVFDFDGAAMRKFVIICYFEVDFVLKNIAFFVLVACASAILYGNLPAQRVLGCEKQGASEAVCLSAEWDSEKVNPLPAYNPDNLKAMAVLQATSQADTAHMVAIKS
ncbi:MULTISPECIES: hypothetical protein [unclassified Raoultella]|uniref:hypothetical protein n=1 Tax=unclassified Raoultella TaxID=2627600 RepID=UPI001D12D32A|nr:MULTISPECIES: hypothetical protein [unclassified Raoultella]